MTTLQDAYLILDNTEPSQVVPTFFSFPSEIQNEWFVVQHAFKRNPKFGTELTQQQLGFNNKLIQNVLDCEPSDKTALEIYEKLHDALKLDETLLYIMAKKGHMAVFDKESPAAPLLNNFCFMLSACLLRTSAYRHASQSVQQDIQILSNFITKKPTDTKPNFHAIYDFMHQKTQITPEAQAKDYVHQLKYASILNFYLAKAKCNLPYNNSNEGFFARRRLRRERNQSILLDCFKTNGSSIIHANDKIKSNFEFVMAAVTQNGYVLSNVNPAFKKNRDIALAAVKSDHLGIYCIDKSFLDDKEIILAACKKSGSNWDMASPRLQEDRDVCIAAAMDRYHAYLSFSKTSKKDFIIINAALETAVKKRINSAYDQKLFNEVKNNMSLEHRKVVFGSKYEIDTTDSSASPDEKAKFETSLNEFKNVVLPALEKLVNQQTHQELKQDYVKRKTEIAVSDEGTQSIASITLSKPVEAPELSSPSPVKVKKTPSRRI